MAETLQRDEIIVRDILDTARALFKKSGFKKTTMGDIARSLGKAKSSLYYYYPGKEDIFEAVLHAEMAELLTQIHQSIRQIELRIERPPAQLLAAKLIANLCRRQPRFQRLAVELREPETAWAAAHVAHHLDFVAQQRAQEVRHLLVGMPKCE